MTTVAGTQDTVSDPLKNKQQICIAEILELLTQTVFMLEAIGMQR